VKSTIVIATVISIFTYLFWSYFPKGFFYLGNAVFITLLVIVIFNHYKTFFWSFFLLCGSINNLLDELFFDPTKLGLNELALLVIIPLIWIYKRRNDRKTKSV
jgi:hypothetical protein